MDSKEPLEKNIKNKVNLFSFMDYKIYEKVDDLINAINDIIKYNQEKS